MNRKVVYLEDNMINAHDNVIFDADIPYEVTGSSITNEDGISLKLHELWVDFRLVHQKERR